VLAFLKGRHRQQSRHRRQAAGDAAVHAGRAPTIADLSLVAYLYHPARVRLRHPDADKNIAVWLDRVKALPGWKHPYD